MYENFSSRCGVIEQKIAFYSTKIPEMSILSQTDEIKKLNWRYSTLKTLSTPC